MEFQEEKTRQHGRERGDISVTARVESQLDVVELALVHVCDDFVSCRYYSGNSYKAL